MIRTKAWRALGVIGVGLLVCFATPARLDAQTVTTGTIAGVVKDSQGGVVPGALVRAVEVDTGLTRDVFTDSEGTYVIALLPPGRYRVEAELARLGKSSAPPVDVLLGNSTRADITIAPQVSETITVVATAPVVDTARPATADSITSEQISNLPLLGRDFKSLALLTPGITEAFGSRITADGARGIATDYNIDGASSNNDFFGENTGGTRAPFSFSQAAIQEFQVIRSQYDSEYGRGVGAQLNAITKSGTNDLHGEAFVFRRNKGWAATRPTTLSSGQVVVDSFLPKDSTQPGFILGGPIVRDRAFYLVNYDGQRQKQPNTITPISQRQDFLNLSPSIQQQAIAKIESFLGHPYNDELGYNTTYNQNTYFGKANLNVGGKNRISVRDNYTNFENAQNQSLGYLSNQGVEHDKFNQLVGQGTTIITDRLINDALVEYSRDERPVEPIARGPELRINITPTQVFGQNQFLPNNTTEKKVQLKDTVHYVMGSHTFKGGTDLLFQHIDNLFPRYRNGVYTYTTVQAYLDNTPNSFQQAYGIGGGLTSWDQNTYAFYGMDTMRFGTNLTVDVGLRYDWQTMPKPAANAFPQHPEFISQIKEDKNNVAPRLGVAYDLFGDGRSVIRGGVGKFFGYMPDILLSNPLTQISGNFNNVTINCVTGTNGVGCPAFPNILSPDQFNQAARVATDIVTISPDFEAQEAWRGSLQFEKQIGANYSAAVGTIFSKLTHVEGSRNINAVPVTRLGDVTVYDLLSPNRKYTDMGVVRELCSCEEASFRSLTFETHRLATSGSRFSWDLNYTWSRSIDEDTNERSTSSSFLYDPFNPALSRGPSDNDMRHRIGGGALYRLPYGFLVAGIFNWHTGVPYTQGIAFTQVGVPGNPNSLNGLSQMTGNIPVFVNSAGNIIDVTQANNFSRQQFADFLAGQGAHIIGRNTFRQPSSHYVDFRVSKSFEVFRGVHAEVLAEVFNLLATRVEQVNTTTQNANLARATYTQATDRYTFTSFAPTLGLTNSYATPDPRQLQVAAKFRF